MKKFLIACLSLAMTGLAANAASQVLMINGAPVEKTVTKIHFEGDNVVLHFGEETESHDMNSVSLAFTNTSGIADAEMFSFNGVVEGSTATVSGLEADTPVTVYSVSGVVVAAATADAEGQAAIDIAPLEAGVYVLVAGKNVVKFSKR